MVVTPLPASVSSGSSSFSRELSTRWGWIVAGVLALHFGLGLHAAFNKSVTHDEIWHLPVGLLNLQTGQFDFDNLNPPLTRMWAALPAWIAGVRAVVDDDTGEIAPRFVRDHPNYLTWYRCGRAANLLLSVAAGALTALWAARWFGEPAGLLAACLYATCPNLLAHAGLVTPDLGLTLTCLAALFVLTLWLDRPDWRIAVLFGTLLGLAQGTKFTAVLLYPLTAIIVIAWPRTRDARVYSRLRSGGQFLLALLISLVIWNGCYFFREVGHRLDHFPFASRSLRGLIEAVPLLGSLPVPLPRDYLLGLDRQRRIMEQAHPVYLDGVWSLDGFPTYYLRVLQYKLPHLLQACFLVGGFLALWTGSPQLRRRQLVLWLPLVALLGIASLSKMQLGIRYVLPALPWMMILGGRSACLLTPLPSRLQTVCLVVICLTSLFSVRHHPHHLAYFNEGAGGPLRGREHLLDSNLDWGQDLHLVKEFMDQHHIEEIGLIYFGTLSPEAVGITYHIPESPLDSEGRRRPDFAFPPGWYAVSVNYVQGRPHTLRLPDGSGRATSPYEFSEFRQHEPVARLGFSIDVYFLD